MILPAQKIRFLCSGSYGQRPMVEPFHDRTTANGMTFGLGPAGYDVRIKQDVTLYPITLWNTLLGRKSFTLASTIERFSIPIDILATVHDKSTWARRGLAAQSTVIESGWAGYLTLELSNHGNEILYIKGGTPIAQIIFSRLETATDAPYKGKYQNQIDGPIMAKYE